MVEGPAGAAGRCRALRRGGGGVPIRAAGQRAAVSLLRPNGQVMSSKLLSAGVTSCALQQVLQLAAVICGTPGKKVGIWMCLVLGILLVVFVSVGWFWVL